MKFFSTPIIFLLLVAFAFSNAKVGSAGFRGRTVSKRLKGQDDPNNSKEPLSYTSTTTTTISSDKYGSNYGIQQRLAQANENWERSNFRLDIANPARFFSLWDFHYPSFDCPYTKERVGKAGDGGKWICGMQELVKLEQCLVYSFGVSDDTSFEEELAHRTNCTIRLFDHKIKKKPNIVNWFPGRVTFAKFGLSRSKPDGELKSIKSIMKKYKDSFIDVLKVDTEGAEWGAMNYTVKSFPQGLPFAQLAIELHLNRIEGSLLKWFKMLGRAGLRAFNFEPNMNGPKRFAEYSFINIKNGQFKMKTKPKAVRVVRNKNRVVRRRKNKRLKF